MRARVCVSGVPAQYLIHSPPRVETAPFKKVKVKVSLRLKTTFCLEAGLFFTRRTWANYPEIHEADFKSTYINVNYAVQSAFKDYFTSSFIKDISSRSHKTTGRPRNLLSIAKSHSLLFSVVDIRAVLV